jgi:hypothetical protein
LTAQPDDGNSLLLMLAYVAAVVGFALILITAANYAFFWNILPPSLLVIGIVLLGASLAFIRRSRR